MKGIPCIYTGTSITRFNPTTEVQVILKSLGSRAGIMTASRVALGDAGDNVKGSDPELNGDDVDGVDEDEIEVIPLRLDPLMQQNASPVDVDKGLRLIHSCRDGDFTAVRSQIAEGSPAGFITKTGWTPIAAAAYSGKSEIVRYLLELGVDSMYNKTVKKSAAAFAQRQQQQSSSTVANGDASGASSSSLGSARVSSSSEQLEPHQLSATNSNASIDGNNNSTHSEAMVLPLSTTSNTAPPAKKILGNGSNTPLHWACYKGHSEIVTILLHAGYNIEDVDPVGNRALHLACSGGNKDVIETLLANSAATDQRNQYGNKPLDLTTDFSCLKLLQKFQSQTQCEWCKETFSRIRRPSLCQHCHNVYCDVKPCSSIAEVVTPVDFLRPGTAATNVIVRSMRYCQECATEMSKTEQELRTLLEAKIQSIHNALDIITQASMPSPPASRPGTQANSSRPVTATAAQDTLEGTPPATDQDANDSTVVVAGGEMDGVEPPSTAESGGGDPPRPTRRVLTNEDIFRALTLSQTDAEALYTSIEAAQRKAVDRDLINRAKQTYRQLVAHVALQEEIKALMVVRPIGVRSLVEPLKAALLNARREGVSHDMLMLGIQVIRSAEAECTLFGCEAMCAKIELGTKKHRQDIARLDASIRESQVLRVNEKLLASAVALRDRLNAEVQLQACLQPFTPLVTTNESGVETALGYRFEDGTEVQTLLMALELRNQQIQSAVEFGSSVDGVSAQLIDEGQNILKQLKKDIKDEMKNEEERRRLEEEAALKAAKKGKKKKA